MRRGDLVLVSAPGDYGKPRPALVIQSDAFSDLYSVTVLPLTSELHDSPLLRISIAPSPENGLRVLSQVMVDKAISLRRERVARNIGRMERPAMLAVDVALRRFLGLDP